MKHSVEYWYKQYCRLWNIKIELENKGYFLDNNDRFNKTVWATLGKYCDCLLRSIKK